MPPGRRNASRYGPAGKSGGTYSSIGRSNSGETVGSGADDKRIDDGYGGGRSLAPKHVPMPVVPVDGQLGFEALSFVIFVVSACLQLLNLYRTVWWLPYSYTGYSMNFYLIDPYLLVFIFTIIARSFVNTLVCRIIDALLSYRWSRAIQMTMRVVLFFIEISILSWCVCHMTHRHDLLKIFYLCYPSLIMYLIIVSPFSDCSESCEKEERKQKYLMDKPLHNCSLNASAIRAEVSTLRSDFNQRLKQAVFLPSASAYVCSVGPIIFAPPHLHYSFLWVTQHVFFFWVGRLTAHLAQTYPIRYCDVLHRAAMHLGRWVVIENRHNHICAQPWNDTVLWPHGSIVRYNRELYRSEGLCTAAEPGNQNHVRFHVFFHNPARMLRVILIVQGLIVLFQLVILFCTYEWYQVLSLTISLVINYYPLFKVGRDWLITWKVYRAEEIIQEKSQMAVNHIAQ